MMITRKLATGRSFGNKQALIALLVLIGLFSVAGVVRFTTGILATPVRKISRLNLVITQSGLPVVYSFNRKDGRRVTFANQDIESARGFGVYQLSKLWELGEIENNHGSELVSESLKSIWGIPLYGYIEIGKDSQLTRFDQIVWQARRGKLKSNLSPFDLWYIWLAFRNVNMTEVQFTFDSGDMVFKDTQLREESIPVAVLNGTEENGLAAQFGEMVTRSGGRVIATGEGSGNYYCRINALSEKKSSYTFWWLKTIWKCEEGLDLVTASRADILISLGSGYLKMKHEKW